MGKQFAESERLDTSGSSEQPSYLPEQGVAGQTKSLGAEETQPVTDGTDRLLPGELEVAPVSANVPDARQAATQTVEVDPVGGAQAVWEQVHQGQAVLPALAYHRAGDVLTGLKRAAR